MLNWLLPYIRLGRYDRPIGIWLLMLPCWWGVTLATPANHIPSPYLLVLFAMGAAVMRGAGCTLNDLIDRDLDAQVKRTKNRPLASGQLSTQQALAFFCFQSLVGLAVLLQLPIPCWEIGLVGLALLIIYPFMKRITDWPQAILGLTFNIGLFMGAASVVGSFHLDWIPLIYLYLAGIFWTITYDTIYALQDVQDDLKVGIKSTALLFGQYLKLVLSGTYALMLLFLILSNKINVLVLILLALSMGWILWTLNPKSAPNCLERFKANQWIGWLIFLGLLV